MKILIAPDKFKGSLTAEQVCQAIQKGIKKFDPSIETVLHPLADGGEGTLEILQSNMDLQTISLTVNDPLCRPVQAHYLIHEDTAFIEMALASGLPLLRQEERNCLYTTTYGTGELIGDAIQKGIRKIYLFIGGSATNDAGLGIAAALGYKLLDENSKVLSPTGNELGRLSHIDDSHLKFDPDALEIYVVCDVKNVLYGPEGAAYTYAQQKGADQKAIAWLDAGLVNFSRVVAEKYGRDISRLAGGGAAGGLGAGAAVFLKAGIIPGIHTIMEVTQFNRHLPGADLVITGEGKLDHQTIQGKVVQGVGEVARQHHIPFAVICGMADHPEQVQQHLNAWAIRQIKTPEISMEEAIREAAAFVEMLSFQLIRDFSDKALFLPDS